jgi:predicted transcriptional regulator
MNRTDLQILADLRVIDAERLLDAGRHAGTYYLLGYAVECALKACVAKQIMEHDFPDKQLVHNSYTHNLEQLLRISGVKPQFDSRVKTDKSFEVNWSTVKDWTEEARYWDNVTEIRARDLFNAVTDPQSGVLTWLKIVW